MVWHLLFLDIDWTYACSCFLVDPRIGLVSLNTFRFLGLPLTTPPSGPEGTVSDIIFNEDDYLIIIAIKGVGNNPGTISSLPDIIQRLITIV